MPDRLRLITRDAFAALAQQGAPLPADTGVMKGFAGLEIKAPDGADATDLSLEIRITTASRDRDRDTIAPAGWKLQNFRKNPVVLYAHDYRSLPIAKDEGITADSEGLTGHPRFTAQDLNPFGFMVYRLLRAHFLNAASVGLIPLQWKYNEDERGLDMLEQEMLEYSICPVPANPEALQLAKKSGVDLAPLKAYCEELLDSWHEEKGLWLPKTTAERALKLADGERKVLAVPGSMTLEAAKAMATDLGAEIIVRTTDPAAEPAAAPPALDPVPAVPAPTPAPASSEPAAAEPALIELAEEPAGLVFELEDDPDPAAQDLIDLNLTDLAAVVGAAVTRAVDAKVLALTGRLD